MQPRPRERCRRAAALRLTPSPTPETDPSPGPNQASGGEVEAAIEMLASGFSPPAAQQQQQPQPQQQGGEGGISAAEAVRAVEATRVPHGADGRLRAMEAALEQLVLAGGSVALPLLLKLLTNIAAQPDEPKFRKVRPSAACDRRAHGYLVITPPGAAEQP